MTLASTRQAPHTSRMDHEALRLYLAERPAWQPILDKALQRYRSYNGLRGEVALDTLAAREVVRGINARPTGRGGSRVTLVELDRAFREETRFACGLVEVLGVHHGEPVLTRAEREQAAAEAWSSFCIQLGVCAREGARHVAGDEDLAERRAQAWADADAGYLQSQVRRIDAQAAEAGAIAARALGAVTGIHSSIALPVLAQSAAGNPHALDSDTAAGRYFERALLHTQPDVALTMPLQSAEERELLLAAANVAIDDVSSCVHVFHVIGDDPLIKGARERGYIVTLPLATVDRLEAVHGARDQAYVVENPAVFSTLVRWAQSRATAQRPTLVCTSGQLSLASRRFLNALVTHGSTLHYGGDFDFMGLTIAQSLVRRWPTAVRLWRMSENDYDRAYRNGGRPLATDRVKPLQQVFPLVTERLLQKGPAYQEGLVQLLEQDLAAAMS